MRKFVYTFKRVIILLHVTAAHIAPPKKVSGLAGCLNLNKIECSSEKCQKLAKFMLERMDLSKDPCDDFYLFTCGKYLNRPEKKLPSMYRTAFEQAKAAVAEILKLPTEQTDSGLLKLIKGAKKECIKGGKTVEDFQIMLQEFGGLPMFASDWKEDSFSWPNFYKIARKYGYEANNIFSIVVDSKWNDSTRRMLHIKKPKVYNYPVEFFEEHLTINNVQKSLGRKFIVEVANVFGLNANDSDVEMTDMFRFGNRINKIFQNASDIYLEKQIFELEHVYPSIPLLNITNILLAPVAEYQNIQHVVVHCWNCLSEMHKLLMRTKKRVIANYLLFQFILENIYLLNHPIRNKLMKHFSMNLENICQEMTIKYFEMILDHEYIERYYNQDFTKIARSMFENIVTELKNSIRDTSLFNSYDQRVLATEKLEAVEAKIGVNDDRILSYEELDKYYKAVNFSVAKNYFWEIRSFLLTEAYSSLQKIGRRTKYMRASLTVARYYPDMNAIHISAAIIQGYLAGNIPHYVNYGRLGRTIAHEVTHAFGTNGLYFNKDGTKKTWATVYTYNKMNEAQECFSKQFGKYKIPATNISVSGKHVSGEVLADNGGYYLSYRAYSNKTNADVELILPGLERYSQKQMFWISQATSRCEKYDAEQDASVLVADKHPVNHLRISGGLKNSKEFAQDFRCARHSGMNPTRKCSFWDT